MPKFSAYMRGEEGPQGDVGQAVLFDGIVSSSSDLPPNTENQKSLVYYVGNNQDGYELYVYATTRIETSTTTYEIGWNNLGSIKGSKGDTGLAAGFASNQNYQIYAVDPNAAPEINIIPDPNSPDTAKVFDFIFGIPRGQNAGFGQSHISSIRNVNTIEEAYVNVTTDEDSPNTAKIFNFEFGIPRGEAAGFGDPIISISTISSLSTASVSITSSGSATSKIFDFHFDIPQGMKGDRGDSFSIYEPVAFTTGSEYWVNSTTFVYPRGDNSKLPVYIYNEDTNSLLNSSFTYTTTDIIYNVQQPFNGTLYLMSGANRPTINIGEISTTSFEGQMSASLNERSTSSDAIIDFTLAHGPTGLPGGFGEVTSTAELIPSASTYIEKNSIVSFSTDYDINDVTVDIEPVQDLHGYDNPWPAGGGKNLLNENEWEIGYYIDTDGNIQTSENSKLSDYIKVSGNTAYSLSGTDIHKSDSAENVYVRITYFDTNKSFISQMRDSTDAYYSVTTPADCAYVRINMGTLATNVQFEESQNPTSYTPYSNICPISGWTGMNVQRTGKNLLPKLFNTEKINETHFSLISDGNSITLDGTVESNNLVVSNLCDYFFIKAGTYIFSAGNLTNIPKISGDIYADLRLPILGVGSLAEHRIQLKDVNASKQITFSNDCYIRLQLRTYKDLVINNVTIKPSLYLMSETDTTFEPSQFTTYPISWSTQAETVYGGSLDVTTGVLTVNRAYLEFDGSENESWNIANTGTENWYYNYFTNINSKSAGTVIAQSLCNTYQINQIANNNTLKGAYITADGKFRVRLDTEDTVENWKTYLNNNHLQFVFPLAEPITYQLTPTYVAALLGQNNIWTDTGDVQVSYNKFNQPYVEITTDEDSPNEAKRFNFHFGIPQGEKGAPGDAFAIYEPLSFTTGSFYWVGNTLVVPRGDNNKLPLFIYNRDNNNIAATFKLENNYIRHDADSPFNGTLYMMSQTNRSTLRIGNVSTTTYGNGSHFSLNEASTSTDAIFDVVLEQGPKGETALTAQVGKVSLTSGAPKVEIEGDQNLIFNFDLPRGFKGDKGDTFTVDVDETIDVLGYNEYPVVETTSTSTGIALKFKLPPSISAPLGDLSQYNNIALNGNLVTNILPVSKGGTGVNQLTTNAIILGNNTAIKQKATSAGAFYATGNNIEPGFGTLPIEYGGTGTTTAEKAWTALGGGSIGKLNSLTANNIPNLDAGKITTGTFNINRIPDLDADKIKTGVFNINRIPTLTTDKLPPLNFLPLDGTKSMTGPIVSQPGAGTNWIAGTKGTSSGIFVKKKALNTNQWIPGITIQTKAGGGWAIGNYDNESLVLVYGTKANIDANNNVTNNYTIDINGNFSGKASNVTGIVDIPNGGTNANNRIAAVQNLMTYEDLGTSATFVFGRKDNYSNVGCISINNLKTTLKLGSLAYKSSLTSSDVTTALGFSPLYQNYPNSINIKNTNADILNPTAQERFYGVRDKNDYIIAFSSALLDENGRSSLYLATRTRNTANTKNIDNYLRLFVSRDGTSTVEIPAAAKASWRSQLNVVNKDGDTLNGPLVIKNTSDVITTAPSGNHLYNNLIVGTDKNGVQYGSVRFIHQTDNKIGMSIYARKTIGSTNYFNDIELLIDSSGNRSVYVSDQTAWRNGLGASNGVWQQGQGGTGSSTFQGARQNLFPTNMENSAEFLIAINTSWATGGYINKDSALKWVTKDAIKKISFTTVDPGAGSNLETGTLLFVYE